MDPSSESVPTGFWTRHRPFLKSIVVTLIYPAVLGTVLYVVLQIIVTPIVAHAAQVTRFRIVVDPTLTVLQWHKVLLVLATLVFYHCDYFYITYTRYFGLAFLIADCLFLVALYVTLVAINPLGKEPPATPLVALCFIIFLLGYLVWDAYECIKAKYPPHRRYYYWVLAWEAASILALALHVGGVKCLSEPRDLIGILGLTTILFVPVVIGKKRLLDDIQAT